MDTSMSETSYSSTTKKNLQPVDIVYEPPKNIGEPIQCYFAPKMYMVFSTYFNSGNKNSDLTPSDRAPIVKISSKSPKKK